LAWNAKTTLDAALVKLSGSDLVGRAWRTTHQHKLHDENGGAAMARKERVSAVLCGVALLLSAGLGNAMDIDTKSFRCITKMTPVRQFYVDNLRGNLDATLAAANSATGAVYPPGSVIQLIPTEAMVKQDTGFNAATHDWEFVELDVSKQGTQIRKRGTVDSSIDLAATALAVTFQLLRSGISFAKAATAARRSR
jgi:hypothetical protein